MVSYHVVSLYTKVPIPQALELIQQKLDNDGELIGRTHLSTTDLIKLCSLCLKPTVFTFREKLYAQTEGLPMGSLLAPIIVNIFIENFEHIVFTKFMCPPTIWKRYVDDSSLYCQSTQHTAALCTSKTKQFNSQRIAKVKMPFLDYQEKSRRNTENNSLMETYKHR